MPRGALCAQHSMHAATAREEANIQVVRAGRTAVGMERSDHARSLFQVPPGNADAVRMARVNITMPDVCVLRHPRLPGTISVRSAALLRAGAASGGAGWLGWRPGSKRGAYLGRCGGRRLRRGGQ